MNRVIVEDHEDVNAKPIDDNIFEEEEIEIESSDELDEVFPQGRDRQTETQTPVTQEKTVDKGNHVSQNDVVSKNDEEKQNAPKKEKSAKGGIVDANDTPLKFRFTAYNKSATLVYDPSYENLTSLNIPQKVRYNGEVYTVHSIDYKVFYECQNIVRIEIPSTIRITYSSFRNFKKLTTIVVAPDHPTLSSEKGILYNKDKSEIIRVPLGFKGTFKFLSSVKKIGNDAFQNCKELTNIEFSSNVTEIGKYAFYKCTGLTNLVIPSNIKSIGYSAFSYCHNLTNVEIQVPTEVKFESNTFSFCRRLKSINIPPHLTILPDGFLCGCSGLENFEIPSHITSIGNSTFSSCSGLTYVTIPKSVTYIGNSAFSNCNGLTNIIIPSNVSNIGSSAFAGCSNLNVLVDNSKKIVNYDVSTFQGCKSLKWAK
ncbi:MAG: leucine-rich repeat domain-containing protein [Paludibacteraceae bacterium]|nr:leucine-rich repeat domain-containing protein [Paludibacteraceae bacterium]